MFGTYRILLALAVLLVHYAKATPLLGHYAVFGFFTLSGFLMTLVVQRNYGYSLRGTSAYALNRVLRIYPLYWTACLVSIGVLFYLDPKYTTQWKAEYVLPGNATEWIKNILLILKFDEGPTLISPAWALTVELFFYICIGLGISRNKKITALWLISSIAYTAYMCFSGAGFIQRYSSLAAGSLPFSIGAAVYLWKDELESWCGALVLHRYAPIFWLAVALANWFFSSKLNIVSTVGFYAHCVLCATITLSLYNQKRLLFISKRLDGWLGDLSYPIYLIHFPVSFLLVYFVRQAGIVLSMPGLIFFFISLPVVLFLAWLMAVAIERQVELVRATIKQRVGPASG